MEIGKVKALVIYLLGVSTAGSVLFNRETLQPCTAQRKVSREPCPVLTPSVPMGARSEVKIPSPPPASPAVPQFSKSDVDILLRLDQPSMLPYDLPGYSPGSGKFHSQAGQDQWVDRVFKKKRNLFVVESGALNGLKHSNSLFFETERQWNCLLVEANPYLWPEVRQKHRKCHFLTAGLSITKEKGTFPFKLAGPLGGFTETMASQHVHRADAEIQQKRAWMSGEQGAGKVIDVSAFPLFQVLETLNRTTVDYWSLDTEGSELKILQGSGLEHFELGVLTVEHNNEVSKRQQIVEFLKQHGISRVVAGAQDDFYANPSYFQKRGMPFPSA